MNIWKVNKFIKNLKNKEENSDSVKKQLEELQWPLKSTEEPYDNFYQYDASIVKNLSINVADGGESMTISVWLVNITEDICKFW